MTTSPEIPDEQSGTLDTAGAPSSDGPYPDALDTELLSAESNQLVTNDAVAGETVLDNEDAPNTEQGPTYAESRIADDGYRSPHLELEEDVDLADEAPDSVGSGS